MRPRGAAGDDVDADVDPTRRSAAATSVWVHLLATGAWASFARLLIGRRVSLWHARFSVGSRSDENLIDISRRRRRAGSGSGITSVASRPTAYEGEKTR